VHHPTPAPSADIGPGSGFLAIDALARPLELILFVLLAIVYIGVHVLHTDARSLGLWVVTTVILVGEWLINKRFLTPILAFLTLLALWFFFPKALSLDNDASSRQRARSRQRRPTEPGTGGPEDLTNGAGPTPLEGGDSWASVALTDDVQDCVQK